MSQAALAMCLLMLVSASEVLAAEPAARAELGAAGAAWPGPKVVAPARDVSKLFAAHCVGCHKSADLARHVHGSAGPDAAVKAELETFLRRHGSCDAAADAAIANYLTNGGVP